MGKCLALYSLSVLPLKLSPLTEDTSNDNCIQLWCQTSGGPLRLGKKRLKHWTCTCTFVAFLNITFPLLYFFRA